jgi:hypothetical protein
MYPTCTHLVIAQQLNDVTAPLYGLTDGGGSALAALPIMLRGSQQGKNRNIFVLLRILG